MNILIRPETSADHDAIRHGQPARLRQGDEARVVDALRAAASGMAVKS